jgi:hypothetical protein
LFPGTAVTVPIDWLHISGVEVIETVGFATVTQVVSLVIEPIEVPHADPANRKPVVPAGKLKEGLEEGMFKTPLL